MSIPSIDDMDSDFNSVHWCHQFTIPLLFDDCLTLLQKVCALWNKLNDVIASLKKFDEEFKTWAESVESQISDLYSKYTALEKRVSKTESDITSLNAKVSDIYNQLSTLNSKLSALTDRVANCEKNITDLRNDMGDIVDVINALRSDLTDLESRVEALEKMLKNLNIIPPVEIYNATDDEFKTGLWQAWWAWMKTQLQFTSYAPSEGWSYSENVTWWETSTHLPRYFQLGKISQPIVVCKLPFVAVYKNLFDTLPTLTQLASIVPYFSKDAFTSRDGFFKMSLTTAFGHTMDEVKFQTSYIPFLPSDSILFKVTENNDKISCEAIHNIQCGVRLHVPDSGTDGYLCVCGESLICSVCPNSDPVTSTTKWDLYIYAIAENG